MINQPSRFRKKPVVIEAMLRLAQMHGPLAVETLCLYVLELERRAKALADIREQFSYCSSDREADAMNALRELLEGK